MATSAAVRAEIIYTLRNDLIGPDPDDPRDAEHLRETLSSAPSHWYLTGFLAPVGQKAKEKQEEPPDDEDLFSALDATTDGESDAPSARRPVFPSSIGLSVLVPQELRRLTVRVTYGTYEPYLADTIPEWENDPTQAANLPLPGQPHSRRYWTRTQHDYTLDIPLNEKTRFDLPIEGSNGMVLRVFLHSLPMREFRMAPSTPRCATIFLVNQRAPVEPPERDRGFVFQTRMTIFPGAYLFPSTNPRGTLKTDSLDEKIGEWLYRDVVKYALGHGISTVTTMQMMGERKACKEVSTTWLPSAEVENVESTTLPNVELSMEELATIRNGQTLRKALGNIVTDYAAWISNQSDMYQNSARPNTFDILLSSVRLANERIERGIRTLETNPVALEAFAITNEVMAAARIARAKIENPDQSPPTWLVLQLAFFLMNIPEQIDPTREEREILDLIFFPTGGGKTEAYLGLTAFTLVLRRLLHPGLSSAGVAVIMQYALPMLTRDPLERAGALICALESKRRKEPQKLGPNRFSLGWWAGKNRRKEDEDPNSLMHRMPGYAAYIRKLYPLVPIDKCPWCQTPFARDTAQPNPDPERPLDSRVLCVNQDCEFRSQEQYPDGIPILGSEDDIHRELPCFLITTLDNFASPPKGKEIGPLLGKNITHFDELGFYGPTSMRPSARPLPQPLLPPDLLIHDELHLTSAPLGSKVNGYETTIEHLMVRRAGDRDIRPKIVASTATVGRAQALAQALFGRSRVEVFPPPGPKRRDSFFAQMVPATNAAARHYVGLSAPGRSQKLLLMRTYITLLAATYRAYLNHPKEAEPYMTLVGYFNNLRELGGAKSIIENEVRTRLQGMSLRRRVGEWHTVFSNRTIDFDCVELTSRQTTLANKEARERLEQVFNEPSKEHVPVDVVLTSKMISVDVDIARLGLMVVCGQPKTTAEYILATNSVGRDSSCPGLVVTLFHANDPRDRLHFERFAAYHDSFYRADEAPSIGPGPLDEKSTRDSEKTTDVYVASLWNNSVDMTRAVK